MESAAAAWSRGLYRPIRAFVPGTPILTYYLCL